LLRETQMRDSCSLQAPGLQPGGFAGDGRSAAACARSRQALSTSGRGYSVDRNAERRICCNRRQARDALLLLARRGVEESLAKTPRSERREAGSTMSGVARCSGCRRSAFDHRISSPRSAQCLARAGAGRRLSARHPQSPRVATRGLAGYNYPSSGFHEATCPIRFATWEINHDLAAPRPSRWPLLTLATLSIGLLLLPLAGTPGQPPQPKENLADATCRPTGSSR